jgi:hypothetical protein
MKDKIRNAWKSFLYGHQLTLKLSTLGNRKTGWMFGHLKNVDRLGAISYGFGLKLSNYK